MKLTKVIGEAPNNKTRSLSKRPRLMPNPFPPETINKLIEHSVTIGWLAAPVYLLIKLWIEDRKARKIVIKKGDFEIEIQGGLSAKAIEKHLERFRKEAEINDESEVKIILPDGCNPKIPKRLLNNLKQK